VQFFTLFQESIVLGQTLKGKLVSYFDVLGRRYVALLERADFDRVGCTEKAYLCLFWQNLDDLLYNFLELSRNESVNFIENY
jgi:hypothetical protein